MARKYFGTDGVRGRVGGRNSLPLEDGVDDREPS